MEQLTVSEAYSFIKFAIGKHPDLAESLPQFRGNKQADHSNLPWCRCSRCRDMPTEKERLCCRKGKPIGPCIMENRRYRTVILDEDVVQTAVNSEFHDNARLSTDINNKSCRHIAYRQFVMRKYGHCGANNRKVVPSCVTWAIRDKWPSTSGEYRGYID